MIYTILESLCSFLNWEGADIRPQIRPRKIPYDGFYPEADDTYYLSSGSIIRLWFYLIELNYFLQIFVI